MTQLRWISCIYLCEGKIRKQLSFCDTFLQDNYRISAFSVVVLTTPPLFPVLGPPCHAWHHKYSRAIEICCDKPIHPCSLMHACMRVQTVDSHETRPLSPHYTPTRQCFKMVGQLRLLKPADAMHHDRILCIGGII